MANEAIGLLEWKSEGLEGSKERVEGHVVVGFCCVCPTNEAIRVYEVNVLPYNQSCANCGKALVKGHPLWPELFTLSQPILSVDRQRLVDLSEGWA